MARSLVEGAGREIHRVFLSEPVTEFVPIITDIGTPRASAA